MLPVEGQDVRGGTRLRTQATAARRLDDEIDLDAAATVDQLQLDVPSYADLLGDTLQAIAAEKAGIMKPGVPVVTAGELTERDREVLAFERQWWKYAGAKEQAVRDLFGLSATRYYQLLNALIDRPEALVADPMLVKRLRRLRATRQRTRSARRLGIDV